MHEYSIVSALIGSVERQARAHPGATVRRLHVRIGRASGVETGLLATAYEIFREGTSCAGAELVIDPVEVRWECPRCGEAIPPGRALSCPACAVPAHLARGDEILLQRIELEVPDV